MKLLIFSPYYPPHIGGLETHSDEFNKYLSKKGVEIFVFTPRLPQEAPETEIRHNNVRIVRFPAFELIHNYPLPKFWSRAFWKQWKLLFKDDYSLVICRTRFFFTSLMAWYYAKKRKFPLVHIEHGSSYAQFNGYCKTKLGILYDQIFGRFVICRADLVIANSHASAEFVHTLSGRTDCHVIYRGIESENIFRIQEAANFKRDHKNKVIISYIGRLIDGKGVKDLIAAISTLNHELFHCFIIGDGPELKRLENLVSEKDLEESVTFFGHRRFDEAIALLKVSDIFVNPSYSEGIPTTVIEAALCKKAIIATNVGGTREVISGHKDGFLIQPHDIQSLAEKLEKLLNNPTFRQSLGENAYQKVNDKFSWPHSIERYLEVFKKILKGSVY
jgi:glycosyltransferase involved in cell wall biosynthesis